MPLLSQRPRRGTAILISSGRGTCGGIISSGQPPRTPATSHWRSGSTARTSRSSPRTLMTFTNGLAVLTYTTSTAACSIFAVRSAHSLIQTRSMTPNHMNLRVPHHDASDAAARSGPTWCGSVRCFQASRGRPVYRPLTRATCCSSSEHPASCTRRLDSHKSRTKRAYLRSKSTQMKRR